MGPPDLTFHRFPTQDRRVETAHAIRTRGGVHQRVFAVKASKARIRHPRDLLFNHSDKIILLFEGGAFSLCCGVPSLPPFVNTRAHTMLTFPPNKCFSATVFSPHGARTILHVISQPTGKWVSVQLYQSI